MCIRDRRLSLWRLMCRRCDNSPHEAFVSSSIPSHLQCGHHITPVSYTHLDVYKRQPTTKSSYSKCRRISRFFTASHRAARPRSTLFPYTTLFRSKISTHGICWQCYPFSFWIIGNCWLNSILLVPYS